MDLVNIIGGEVCTNSRRIAFRFDKQHKNVLQTIANLECSAEFRRLNFKPSYYLNDQNKEQPYYEITRDGFSFLAMGFTGADAAKFKEDFINAFNKMEATLKPSDDEIVMLGMRVLQSRIEKQNTTIELQESVIKAQAPKVEYVDKVLDADGLITTTTIAKELNMTAIELNRTLNDLRIIYKQQHDNNWVLFAPHQGFDYTGTRTTTFTDSHGHQRTSIQTLWTERGRLFIHKNVNKKLRSGVVI